MKLTPSLAGYATTLAATYPGVAAMASGFTVNSLTSYARNTKPVYDANGQFSILVTPGEIVFEDGAKGALTGGFSNLVLTYVPPAINTGLDQLGGTTSTTPDISKSTGSIFGDMNPEDEARYNQYWQDVSNGKTVDQRMGFENPIDKLITVGKQPYIFQEYHPDPAKQYHGSGQTSHPVEWTNKINNLKNQGVEVVENDRGAMGYVPQSDFRSYQVIIDNNASYSALIHEEQHYLDDLAKGFLGFEYNYQSINRVKNELNAYMTEIKIAEQAGNKDLANQLFENYINYIKERNEILFRN